MERIQKIISKSGYTSRRKAEELIKQGKVYVNGELATLGMKVSYEDDIEVEGVSIQREEKVYYLLNKPEGYICSLKDEKNRPVITELIDEDKRIYPVGRLDYNTTGLIILTNDGELDNILTHPSFHIEKTYIAKLDKKILTDDIYALKKGVVIDNRRCTPTRVKVKSNNKYATVEISIIEGRNHIVKKVFGALGYKVIRLHRSKYGFLVDDIPEGNYRKLTLKEVHKLYAYKVNNK
jgi:23S rRNA pseudouridine2605 synthase